MAIFKTRNGDSFAVNPKNITYVEALTFNMYIGDDKWREVKYTKVHFTGGHVDLPFESFQDVADCLQ